MKSILTLLILMISVTTYSQVFSNKEVGKKNETLADSLKNTEYPFSLPIWGDKVTKAGYDLPYPAGLSVQYFWQESLINITNLEVGFNNGPMNNLDGIVRFDDSKATASAVTFRPDVWVFPFLSVYGILGKSQASTQVDFGVWVPDADGNETEVLTAGTVVDFKTTTFGLGFTPTIGVGGGFLALDMNVAWTDVPQLKDPARTFVFGPRFGKNFKLKKPERSVAVWVGGFRVNLNSETYGSINLADVFPDGGAEASAKIDQGIQKVLEADQNLENWYNGLTEAEQNNPINKAKYENANAALDKAGQILTAADGAVNTISTSTVQYSMDKQVKDHWNFIVGGQFQLNKHFMIRLEYGFLGSREQVMTGVQYRFGL